MMSVLIIFTFAIIFLYSLFFFLTKKEIKKIREEKNQLIDDNKQLSSKKNLLESETKRLKEEQSQINAIILDKDYQKKLLETSIEEKQIQLRNSQASVENFLQSQKSLSEQAFQDWWSTLEKDYSDRENEYKELLENLQESYSKIQNQLMQDTDSIKGELEKLKASRDAAIEAARREKEVQEQSSFYCLQVSEQDKADILKLNNIKPSLNKPRVLSMLEWSTFIQKPLKALGIKITGSASPVCGIYKITSLLSGECYIGQSVDIASRFLEHGKCGMDIDRPQGNKLYAAMVRDGIWNFSWEVLEICPREQLDEKEKFYINLYNSYNMGYNSTQGNH